MQLVPLYRPVAIKTLKSVGLYKLIPVLTHSARKRLVSTLEPTYEVRACVR
jgi:hypothetical protein